MSEISSDSHTVAYATAAALFERTSEWLEKGANVGAVVTVVGVCIVGAGFGLALACSSVALIARCATNVARKGIVLFESGSSVAVVVE